LKKLEQEESGASFDSEKFQKKAETGGYQKSIIFILKND
jgi:hypothetical protein